jgi:hypothetical protein
MYQDGGNISLNSFKLFAVTAHCIQARLATTPIWVRDIKHQPELTSDVFSCLPDAVDEISIMHFSSVHFSLKANPQKTL